MRMPMSVHGPLLDLEGRVALVTGASRGIGAATALRLAEAGARVALIARSRADLDDVAATLPESHALALPADVSSAADIDAALTRVRDHWGAVDILVNNAGEIATGDYVDVDSQAWTRMLDINLGGAFRLVQAVGPGMQAAGWGRIVMVTSVTAQTGGVSGAAHYSASKGGLAALTKTLARDLAASGVTVNAVAPGQIDTSPEVLPVERRAEVVSRIPLGRLGEPRDVADAILFLASDLASYITGATIDVNGGLLMR